MEETKKAETQTTITVDQAWEIVKQDAIEKIKTHLKKGSSQSFFGALGLDEDYTDKEETHMDAIVDAVNQVDSRSEEVRAMLEKSRNVQEFIIVANLVFMQQGEQALKKKMILQTLSRIAEK